MRRRLISLSLLASVLGACATAPGGRPETAARTCPGSADLPMIKYDGVRPAVEVMVNGRGPYLFLIDTGAAGQMRADTSLVERLGLPVLGDIEISDGSSAPDRAVKNVGIDSLGIGPLVFRGLSGPSRSYNGSGPGRKIDGIIGFDLLSDCLLTLDYARNRVVIAPGSLSRSDRDVIPFDRASGSPGVTMMIGRHRVQADVDSGSDQRFNLPASLANRITLTGPLRLTGHARAANIRYAINAAPIAETIRIGRLEWPAPEIEMTEAFELVNIGSGVLGDVSLTFDQRQGLVRLTRPGRRQRR